MRRVVVQVTCSLHETVSLDDWCASLHASVRATVRSDTRNIDADDDSIAVFVIRTYETTPKLRNRAKHTRKSHQLSTRGKDKHNGAT